MNSPDRRVLDNPVWEALSGGQRGLGTVGTHAGRFHPDISPFGGLADHSSPAGWAELANLLGRDGITVLVGLDGEPPPQWTILRQIAGVQMVAEGFDPTAASPGDMGDLPLPLGTADVDEMLALVAEAQPGPFLRRTVEFGGYWGVRQNGRLVAMAGERLHPPGYVEISAVATHPDCRRRGLAGLLVRHIAGSIGARREVPFLHASASNVDAIRLYESMGFTRRRAVRFDVLGAPGVAGTAARPGPVSSRRFVRRR